VLGPDLIMTGDDAVNDNRNRSYPTEAGLTNQRGLEEAPKWHICRYLSMV
jgi:hypothetical protein